MHTPTHVETDTHALPTRSKRFGNLTEATKSLLEKWASTSTQRLASGLGNPLNIHPERQVKGQSRANWSQCPQASVSGMGGGKECLFAPHPHWCPLCPQGSAFVLVKALPATSYSSSSPPSSSNSQWPARWLLRTSTSHPGRVVWANCPRHTRSASSPAEGAEGRESKDAKVLKYPQRRPLDSLRVLPLPETCYFPSFAATSLGKSPLRPRSSSEDLRRRCFPFLCS